jgi:putative glutamine amidotransferase
MRPLVAVPAYVLRAGRVSGWADGAVGVPDAYTEALLRAGVRPGILALADDGPADEVLEPFAGLVLIGGGDVSPDRYGAAWNPQVYGVDNDRDERELSLAREAVKARMPVLAICRGLQVLNVALGGTLLQHLPDLPGIHAHGRPATDGRAAEHGVLIDPGSRLADAVDGEVLPLCTSIHHQAADRLAPGLIATARSNDGLVEALETEPGDGWVLAVQWHPERTAAIAPRQQAIFDAFGSVVRAARLAGSA